jgi:hypothetical protein
LNRVWGEHKTHMSIEKSIAAVRRLLEREKPSSPSVCGILSAREFAALEHLAQYAAAVSRKTPAASKRASRGQLTIWPLEEIRGRRQLLGDWRPAAARRGRARS